MNKSAYFLLVLGIGSALILTCFLLPDEVTQSLRKETMEVLGPILRTADKPVSFFSRMDSKLKTLDQAQDEVTRLHQQVAELQLRNQLLTDKDPEALGVLRHSTAHIMARAVMRLFPGVQLAFGPALEHGYY